MTTATGIGLYDLAFPNERGRDHWYDVLDSGGRVVARYTMTAFTRHFTAETPDGRLLCTGRPRRLIRRYVVKDAERRTVLWIRTKFWSALWTASRRSLHIDGQKLSLRGAGERGPSWTLTDTRGRVAVQIGATGLARYRFFSVSDVREPLVAHVNDPQWRDLALLIALVVGNREESEAMRFGDWGP